MSTGNPVLPLTETVEPSDRAAVRDAVRDAYGADTPVYPIGGRTCLHYGVRPALPGIGLSLGRLARVVDYPARDLTITVEAGITMADLAAQLAKERQRLPVDVVQSDRATAGGVVATNRAGPRRYRCGTIRDYVIGIQAVDGTGMVFSGGGRVVKNAAGYNLCRLLTGSLGTLGVITQVTFMVKPIPESSAFLACELPDYHTADRLLADLVDGPTLPAAIEFLAGPVWRDDPAVPAAWSSSMGRLVVGFEGTEPEVGWMLDQLSSRWSEAGIASPVTVSADRAGPLWHRLTEVLARLPDGEEPDRLTIEIRVLPGATMELVARLREVDPNCSIQAHAGDGVILARLAPDPDQAVGVLGDRIRPAVAAAGGHLVVLSYPRNIELDRSAVWGPPGDGAAVMQAIKDRFDPKGLLNPGRFAYGDR